MTLSKPPWLMDFLPTSVSMSKLRPDRSFGNAALWALRTAWSARARTAEVVAVICTRLALAPGSVRLNKSSASSSLSTLMVSARATSSSARVLDRSSHSAVFVLQLVASSLRNSLSSAKAAWESERSSFSCTMLTPSSPICTVFASTVSVSAATSFFFAAMSPSYDLTAASSVAVASAKSFAISPPNCFKMPTISPLDGAYSLPCAPDKNETKS
mmetsp:Transcript_81432/g.205760  ORF Transcript_81432/g.205760 Transcript_81432/m.205760 type:complete len:214 (+) Transcript_81432:1056-1697(+)